MSPGGPIEANRPNEGDEPAAGRLERIGRLLAFLEVAERLKAVERAAYVVGGGRRENSAEHAWHACLFALLLHREVAADVDVGHVLALLVVHDLVEIYAGDTPAFDAARVQDQREREAAAAEQLFALLPEDLAGWLCGLWAEFEAGATVEARFAAAVDCLQGAAQQTYSGGGGWREYRVTRRMTERRLASALELDPSLAAAVELLWQRAEAEGLLAPDTG